MSENSWTKLGKLLVIQCATATCGFMMPKLGAAINFAYAAKYYCCGEYVRAVASALSGAADLNDSSSANAYGTK